MNSQNNSTINYVVLRKEEADILKCEFCDEHLKRKYIELKEILFRLFKNSIKLIKLIRGKEIRKIKEFVLEISQAQADFIVMRKFMEKVIKFRKSMKFSSKNEFTIILNGVNDKEKKEFFDDILTKKENLKKYLNNIIELERMSMRLEETIDEYSFISF